jgi:hypothetical protein
MKLSEAEQRELREWRSTTDSGKGKQEKDKARKKVVFNEKSIAAVVDKKLDAKLKAAQDTNSQSDEAEAFIASCLQKFAKGELAVPKSPRAATASSAKAANTTILNSILGRAKNPSKDE